VPRSENCGGVLEPLYAGVPTIASRVGGLPEVVIEGVTGVLVPARAPEALAAAIVEVLDNQSHHRTLAAQGHALVKDMFDVRRTAREVADIYDYVCGRSIGPPPAFNLQASLAAARNSFQLQH
jgi:glycosyltransferase involved in cell wall biosynthesis